MGGGLLGGDESLEAHHERTSERIATVDQTLFSLRTQMRPLLIDFNCYLFVGHIILGNLMQDIEGDIWRCRREGEQQQSLIMESKVELEDLRGREVVDPSLVEAQKLEIDGLQRQRDELWKQVRDLMTTREVIKSALQVYNSSPLSMSGAQKKKTGHRRRLSGMDVFGDLKQLVYQYWEIYFEFQHSRMLLQSIELHMENKQLFEDFIKPVGVAVQRNCREIGTGSGRNNSHSIESYEYCGIVGGADDDESEKDDDEDEFAEFCKLYGMSNRNITRMFLRFYKMVNVSTSCYSSPMVSRNVVVGSGGKEHSALEGGCAGKGTSSESVVGHDSIGCSVDDKESGAQQQQLDLWRVRLAYCSLESSLDKRVLLLRYLQSFNRIVLETCALKRSRNIICAGFSDVDIGESNRERAGSGSSGSEETSLYGRSRSFSRASDSQQQSCSSVDMFMEQAEVLCEQAEVVKNNLEWEDLLKRKCVEGAWGNNGEMGGGGDYGAGGESYIRTNYSHGDFIATSFGEGFGNRSELSEYLKQQRRLRGRGGNQNTDEKTSEGTLDLSVDEGDMDQPQDAAEIIHQIERMGSAGFQIFSRTFDFELVFELHLFELVCIALECKLL
eukprot:Nk52_evm38s2118 gene=Nk52_evmTU38s2118